MVVFTARVVVTIVAVVGLLWATVVGMFLALLSLMHAVVAEGPPIYMGVALVVTTATLGFAAVVVLGIYAIWHTDEVLDAVRRVTASARRHRARQ